MKIFNFYKLLAFFLLAALCDVSAASLTPLDSLRVKEIKSLLSKRPTGYGEPISNRKTWRRAAADPANANVIQRAEEIIETPFPEWSDSLVIQYSTTGIRKDADAMFSRRFNRLSPLVFAECLENKGRFLPAINEALLEYCKQPTWVLVAHDHSMNNYYGTRYHVDLAASGMADQLGQTLYLLGDKLPAATTDLVRARLYERIYEPVMEALRTLDDGNGRHRWLIFTNNWNSVCLAGVTSSVLSVVDDVNVRAIFAAAAEKYTEYGINGYLEDGYCPEGLGYYNYGFKSMIRLRETLYRATDGELDIFEHPRLKNIATFAPRSEIINGVYPSIADCASGVTPYEWILWYCNRAFGWEKMGKNTTKVSTGTLADGLISLFSKAPCKAKGGEVAPFDVLRSYFDKAGVLSCRPERAEWDSALALNIKCGSNNESHNHNDVGSYTIVAGDDVMMGDMGGPSAYTSKTFSSQRYTLYPMFSSYGHPVPLIGGEQQYASSKAIGRATANEFTDGQDWIEYDITSTYNISKLNSATRKFVYDRDNNGTIELTDSFEASSSMSFETAITTRQQVELKGDKILLISDDNTVEVTVQSSLPYTVKQATVSDYSFKSFTRVGIELKGKAESGFIKLTYRIL